MGNLLWRYAEFMLQLSLRSTPSSYKCTISRYNEGRSEWRIKPIWPSSSSSSSRKRGWLQQEFVKYPGKVICVRKKLRGPNKSRRKKKRKKDNHQDENKGKREREKKGSKTGYSIYSVNERYKTKTIPKGQCPDALKWRKIEVLDKNRNLLKTINLLISSLLQEQSPL